MDYQEKYFKCKFKYLNLKNMIGGKNLIIKYVRVTDSTNYEKYLGDYLKISDLNLDSEKYVLGTRGLAGCTAIAININNNLVWMSHIISDIKLKYIPIILQKILFSINTILNSDIEWRDFSTEENQISLIAQNPSRKGGEIILNDGTKLASDVAIKNFLEENGVKNLNIIKSNSVSFSIVKNAETNRFSPGLNITLKNNFPEYFVPKEQDD